MREWWVNVEVDQGRPVMGCSWRTRAMAVRADGTPPDSAYRLHVRLKPEGAPRRYASESERWWWENEPETARFYSGREWTPEQIIRMKAINAA